MKPHVVPTVLYFAPFGAVFFLIIIVAFACSVCIPRLRRAPSSLFTPADPDGGLFALTLLAGMSADDGSVKFVFAGVGSKRAKWEKERRGKNDGDTGSSCSRSFHCASKKISVHYKCTRE